MALLTRVYFNAVFGALGGLLGWMLFSVFGRQAVADGDSLASKLLFDGALIGVGVGFLVVGVDALRDGSWRRFARMAAWGALLGAVGGALGMWLAEAVNYALVGSIGSVRESSLKFFLAVLARGLGFLFIGLAVGVSEGVATRSLAKLLYGSLGGVLGGFVGGVQFGLVYLLTLNYGGDAALAGAAGFVLMGLSIGALSALVQGVFQPASVRVLRGWQEGREYDLDKPDVTVGRDEAADIALFRDMRVEKRHVTLQRDGDRYLLLNHGAPPEFTRVNDRPVSNVVELNDDDRIQLGQVLLKFQRREAKARRG